MSNPPYVTGEDKTKMSRHVVDYEPAAALYVTGDDPLIYYRHIARLAPGCLTEQGMLYLEINDRFSAEVAEVFRKAGFTHIQVSKDLNRRDRFVLVGF